MAPYTIYERHIGQWSPVTNLKLKKKQGSDNREFELERTLTTQTALKLSVLNTFNHNYKPRKHTINIQITCAKRASDSMENQNLETKKNLYVRQ